MRFEPGCSLLHIRIYSPDRCGNIGQGLFRDRKFVILWRPPNELATHGDAAKQAEFYQREVTMDEKKFKEELDNWILVVLIGLLHKGNTTHRIRKAD
jgi:hypothetical protein